MSTKEPEFLDFFKEIPDHRIERRKLYSVEEILLLSFCAVISGCSSWDDIELYGQTKLEELRLYLPYENGCPSDDTLRRFFRTLDSKAFEDAFIKWVQSFQLNLEAKVVAVDGKTSRRSFDGDSKPMHMVSAFASEFGVVLGQLKTHAKSNEITAIPELIKLLDLKGAIVTIDAMGCQHKIATQITDQGASYIFSLKGNQSTLHDDVKTFFEAPPRSSKIEETEQIDKAHGRFEHRKCRVCKEVDWLKEQHENWSSISSIIEIESIREVKNVISTEKRYYISSLNTDALTLLKSIRYHWGVENQLHWVLDMTFEDDQSRIRKGNAPVNMAVVKKITMNLLRALKQKPEHKRKSLKVMRKMAGWNPVFLDEVLRAKF